MESIRKGFFIVTQVLGGAVKDGLLFTLIALLTIAGLALMQRAPVFGWVLLALVVWGGFESFKKARKNLWKLERVARDAREGIDVDTYLRYRADFVFILKQLEKLENREVCIDGKPVGRLTLDPDGRIYLTGGLAYLEQGKPRDAVLREIRENSDAQ